MFKPDRQPSMDSIEAVVIFWNYWSTWQSESNLEWVWVTNDHHLHLVQRFPLVLKFYFILCGCWLKCTWLDAICNTVNSAAWHWIVTHLHLCLQKMNFEKNEFSQGEFFVKNKIWNNIIPTWFYVGWYRCPFNFLNSHTYKFT